MRATVGLRSTVTLTFVLLGINTAFADCPDTYFLSIRISSKSKCESQHLVTVGSGIVSPSLTAVFAENPAGLAYNAAPKVLLTASKLDSSISNPWRYNATFVTGNGTLGAGAGLFNYNYGSSYESTSLAAVGTGLDIAPLNITIGSSLYKILSNPISVSSSDDEILNSTSWTFGAIWNAKGVVRVGVNGFNIFSRERVLGAGIGTFFGNHFSLAVDATQSLTQTWSTDPLTSYLTLSEEYTYMVKGGLGIAFDLFQTTVTYGAYIGNPQAYSNQIEDFTRSGLSLGIAAEVGKFVKLLFYYNRLELYYFGALIGLN